MTEFCTVIVWKHIPEHEEGLCSYIKSLDYLHSALYMSGISLYKMR